MSFVSRVHMQQNERTVLTADPFTHVVHYIQQQCYTEAGALLALARAQLAPDQAQLATLLETVVHECTRYAHLQRRLQETTAQLAVMFQDLETCGTILHALKPELLSELNRVLIAEPDESLHVVEDMLQNTNMVHAVCLAPFSVQRGGIVFPRCANRNGQAILRYLIAQPDHRASVDMLVGLYWPEDEEDVALHKLHVSMSMLRRSLQIPEYQQEKYILYKQGTYFLNPDLTWHSDVDDFLSWFQMGRQAETKAEITCFERACALYTRPFLLEDRYIDWSFIQREQLARLYSEMCHTLALRYLEKSAYEIAAHWAMKLLEQNRSNETAYRLLMATYALDGRRHEMIQLYQRCQHVLREELNMEPMPETRALYEELLKNEPGGLSDVSLLLASS